MEETYPEGLTDRTATALCDFAQQAVKLAMLPPGGNVKLRVSYFDAPYRNDDIDIIVYAERDEDGIYFFNEAKIGPLQEALEVYALACAALIKAVATDECREEYLENAAPDHDTQNSYDFQSGIALFTDEEEPYETIESNEENIEIYEEFASLKRSEPSHQEMAEAV